METVSDSWSVEIRLVPVCTYVNLIRTVCNPEQIIYLIKSIMVDIIYVAEARIIRHANNQLAVEKET